MTEPLFSADERVSTIELPAEIRNEKDPAKVAAYYQRREGLLREEMRRTQAQPPTTRVTVEHPVEERPSVTFSPEEAQAARGTLIATARQTARVNKPYWDRLVGDIEKLMAEQPPENQVNSIIWETCYNTLLGMNMDRLLREDKERTDAAARVALERSSAPPDAASAPLPLPVEVTSKILPGLGLTEAKYRKAQAQIANGSWPLTSENVSGERKIIGG